ncbi:MAG: RnfABCDGE type electron transport complex subunit B [Pseudomonadota bacterium]|nr:RnfABCDGE type electron transport complex subunit B [Pseudomonadota bacterium]
MNDIILREKINNILPQTQCRLCTYPSCRDYASAITKKDESIDKCQPGGVETLIKISEITKKPYKKYIEKVKREYKSPSIAIIDEDICIGCTKCIQACPVDAIIGSAKSMHSVIISECSGCDLCIPACPVDCISTKQIKRELQSNHLKSRYDKKNLRIKNLEMSKNAKHIKKKMVTKSETKAEIVQSRKRAIHAALARVKTKKDSQE